MKNVMNPIKNVNVYRSIRWKYGGLELKTILKYVSNIYIYIYIKIEGYKLKLLNGRKPLLFSFLSY